MHRIFNMRFGALYPAYLTKVVRMGRTRDELHEVLQWLTGYDEAALSARIQDDTTVAQFFAGATMNPNAALVTGVVCGVRVENVEDPLMREIRRLDKLVDELAKGRPMSKVLRA